MTDTSADQQAPERAQPEPDTLTEAQRREALEVARRLATLGIPIFVAPPAPRTTTGFALPTGWQQVEPDPAVVDAWRPGYALCAVMGRGLDLLDIDPRNGGGLATLNGTRPYAYATAATPSGGWHLFIASLGVGSRAHVWPGIDVKGGLADGTGRGFAFLSPTEKPSKLGEHDGAVRPYRWVSTAELDELPRYGPTDPSGRALAARVTELRRFVAKPRVIEAPGRLGEWATQREAQAQAAAERAINEKLAAIRDWDPAGDYGGRQTVMRAALTLGGYVGGGYLDEDRARELLEAACAARWGSADAEDATWVDQGLADGRRAPFHVYTPEQEAAYEARAREHEAKVAAERARREHAQATGAGMPVSHLPVGYSTSPERPQGPPPAPPGAWATPAPPPAATGTAGGGNGQGPPPPPPPIAPPPFSVYHHLGPEPFDPAEDGSDQGQAEAVAGRMLPVLRYGVDSGTWLVRGAECWREREDMGPWAIATLARLMPLGATPVPKEVADRTPEHWQATRRAAFMSSAGASKVGQKLRAIVRNTDHPSGLELAALDTEPEVLWAGGMPYDLRASRERPTLADLDPATPHLHTAYCAPQVRDTPAWDAFVAAVLPDEALRAWALRVLSVSLAGYPDAVLPILVGPERTGKSSLVALLVKALGSYGHAADPRLLSGAETHASIVYALKGRRLSFVDEGPRGGKYAAERLKQLTGGAQLTGNAMRANPITFDPTHTLVMTSNEEPPLSDPALMARLRVIPCESDPTAVRAARQALTPAVWAREAPGVLAALMAECAAWLADPDTAGLAAAPEALKVTVAEMEAAQNPVTRWVEEVTTPAEPGTPGRELYRSYLAWHDQQPELRRVQPPTETAFGRKLTALGYPPIKRRDGAKTCWYRSLSVRGGGGYGPPMPPPGPVPSVGATEPGSNPPHEHGTSSLPSSDPISSSSVPSVPGQTQYTVANTHITPKEVHIESLSREIGSSLGTRNGNPESSRVELGVPGLSGESERGRNEDRIMLTHRGGTVKVRSASPLEGEDWPEGFDPLQNVTVKQKRVLAAHLGCTEAEAGEALKEHKRRHRVAERQAERAAKVVLASGPEMRLPVVVDRELAILPPTPAEVEAVLTRCLERSAGELTVDMENTGYPVGHRLYGLRTVQLGDEEAVVVLDADDPAQADVARRWLAAAPVLVAHSGQADLVACAVAGLGDFEALMAKLKDTAVWARLSDPKVTGSDPDLKSTAPAILGEYAVTPTTEAARKALFAAGGWLTKTEHDTPIERSGWAQASKTGATMVRYAGADVLDTAAISKRIPQLPDWLVNREHAAQHMTSRVTYRGIQLDAERIAALDAEHRPAREGVGARILGFPGTAIENPGSDQQVARALLGLGAQLPRTEKGNPQVAAHVLKALGRDHAGTAAGELAALVLDWRHHDTVLGTFLGPYRTLIEHGDGRARPTIYTVGTDTGRMSCVRPNVQQPPREGGIRGIFLADPGHVWVSADFSGVELRGAAALSGDPDMLHMITEEDAGRFDGFHWALARQAFGPEATKAHRYTAKRGVFGTFYGGGAERLAQQVGVPVEDMRAIRQQLRALAPHFFRWSDWLQGQVRAGHTQYPSYSGRVIHFPANEPHKAPAYAIQGTCRELLIDALMRWRQTRWGTCTLIPVHDELIVQVPAEDAHEATLALVECMRGELVGPTGARMAIIADAGKPDEATGRYLGSPFWEDAS